MTRVLVIDNYDSFTYNLVQYLGELGAELEVVRNDATEAGDLLERAPDRVVVSPGPRTPAEAGISVDAIRGFAEAGVPVLGVCLGHQALATAFGGSVVRGRPVHGKTAMDALKDSLPVGTVSGAPKIRAMQIIDELEPVRRGPYGGAVGYLSYTGELDTCIYIRSAVVKDGRVHFQAGGGIVVDSEAEYEVRETEAKAGAVIAAIELACAQGDWA